MELDDRNTSGDTEFEERYIAVDDASFEQRHVSLEDVPDEFRDFANAYSEAAERDTKQPRTSQRSADDESAPKPGFIIFKGRAAVFNEKSKPIGPRGFIESIKPGAFKGALGGNIRLTREHDARNQTLASTLPRNMPPSLHLEERSDGLYYRGISPDDLPTAQSARSEIRSGITGGASFRFHSPSAVSKWSRAGGQLTRTITQFKKIADVSIVGDGAYEGAGTEVLSMSDRSMADAAMESDEGIEFEGRAASGSTGLTIVDVSWDGSAAEKLQYERADGGDGKLATGSEQDKYGEGHFWVGTDPSLKGEYKLPFATVQDGKLVAVKSAIFAAAAAVQGARGGVDIPAADVPAVKAKIGAYYAKLNMKPPWEADGNRSYEEDDETVTRITRDIIKRQVHARSITF